MSIGKRSFSLSSITSGYVSSLILRLGYYLLLFYFFTFLLFLPFYFLTFLPFFGPYVRIMYFMWFAKLSSGISSFMAAINNL